MFHGFEYPKEWIYEGRAWNEDYLVRAFLMHNGAFKVRFFNSFFARFHEDEVGDKMPLYVTNTGGLWLKRFWRIVPIRSRQLSLVA